MRQRTRTWLRAFVRLGARMKQDDVPLADIERQEDTVLRALELLDTQPGLVLADEVGMGKTFEALGVIAAMRHEQPDRKICIVTPGPDLNRKWKNAIDQCSDPEARIHDFEHQAAEAFDLAALVQTLRTKTITLVPVSAFQGARGGADQTYLLSAFARWKGLHGTTTNALFRRFRDGKHERVDPTAEAFLDTFSFDEVEPHLETAFHSGDADERGLDEIFMEGGIDSFELHGPVRRALDLARFRLVRALSPELGLLVVDEAHKLKNPESLRHRGVASVFDRKYERALFLTATPFQLDISELRQVFSLFARAKGAPATMDAEVDSLFTAISEYQDTYDLLEQRWRTLDAAQAALFARYYAADAALSMDPEDVTLRPIVELFRKIRTLKNTTIEPGFQRWMVRSIHHEKRVYRRHAPRSIAPAGESLLPFLVYERFIAELFRTGDTTHKAAVEVNMVSSFEAAAQGNLFDVDRVVEPSVEDYRRLLRAVLTPQHGGELRDHPKLERVVGDAMSAADRGEKTLIFCGRTQTISKLSRELDARWNERLLEAWRQVYPDATEGNVFGERDGQQRERGYLERIRERLHRPQDALYLALRERYLQTLIPATRIVPGNERSIAERATALLQSLSVGQTAATRLDYKLAKRCVERAIVERWMREHEIPPRFRPIVDVFRSDEFLRFGLDRTPDELEGDEVDGGHRPSWIIGADLVDTLVSDRRSLWQSLGDELQRLLVDGVPDLELRVLVVERLARYLTRRDVLFVPELLLAAKRAGKDVDAVSSLELGEFIDRFWDTPAGSAWVARLREFLRYLLKRPRPQRIAILHGPIATGSFVRHTVDSDSREGLREAFNTPLNPMVLIANEVMQEGLDLHHNCRQLVHHDLAWNPAQLEQRVGRIDRLGSLVRRVRETNPAATLDIHYPLLARTIDERMYRTVKAREKWLEFLLGARPNFNEYALDENAAPDLPPGLAESLAVDLRPPRAAD